MQIPFNISYYTGREIEYIKDAISRGHISGDGYYTRLVLSFFKKQFSANKMLLTTSATDALEMACLLIDLKPGDEVIMPSFTFPSTANAVMLRGAKPIFAEIDEKTLNIDIADIERKITNRTKAIIPVHYGGVGSDMESIMQFADFHSIYIIEDAAQAVNAKYKKNYLGTLGDIGCFSFHQTKNYGCGEGGAILLNTKDEKILERADLIHQKGTDRIRFLKREIDRYCWTDVGSSYAPSDILMAFLYAQLEDIEIITKKRQMIYNNYLYSFKKYEDTGTIKMPFIPSDCEINYHLFYIIFRNGRIREKVQELLKYKGISTATHFYPLHISKMGKLLGYRPGDLPITERIGQSLLRLPFYTRMTAQEQRYVIQQLKDIMEEIGEN